MQNFAPFWIFVTSRFINGFFRKNSHPPIRYKGRSLQWQWKGLLPRRPNAFFRNISRTTAIDVRVFCLPIKTRKRMPTHQNQGNRKIAEPERFFCLYPRSNISTCLVKSTKACKSIILNWWTKQALIWVQWSPLCS